ncbi:hypothetical protein ZIOFF_011494 [Zingiber officinale]|uniref:Uncharacterized protein n=1 Tax=Zingiber officinale TaxID=94328 RepID=A0A8J5I682_ZINOF|nr:hypothetical protein ZIOFF_011494 [Zingiber officinale]
MTHSNRSCWSLAVGYGGFAPAKKRDRWRRATVGDSRGRTSIGQAPSTEEKRLARLWDLARGRGKEGVPLRRRVRRRKVKARGHGGIPPLIDLYQVSDSISQSIIAATFKNLSAMTEVRQTLVDEGIVHVMINVLDYDVILGLKEQAVECMLQLTSETEKFW